MKKKISQEELAELRKKEQARKEMEYELQRDLEKQDIETRNLSSYNRLGVAGINFFGTLIICYAIYFIVLFKARYFFRLSSGIYVEFPTFVWYIQILFWIAACWSLFSKKSFFDVLLQKYTDFMS